MKVAVTGGTGFVGKTLVPDLLKAGYEVRVLSRHIPGEPVAGAIHFQGSVVTGEGLDAFVEGADAVIHLVGLIREVGKNTFRAVHHEGTVKVLIAASRAGIKRYLHMSALGSREGAKSTYHQTKWAAEEAVRASGLDWTIFRPSVIFGKGDSFTNMLADFIRRSPVVPVIGGGSSRMQPVSIDDVATSFRSSLQSEHHIHKVYELGGPQILELMYIIKYISQLLDKKPLFVSVPVPIVTIAVKLAQAFGIPLPLTSDQLIMLLEDNIVKGGDPVKDLGVEWTSFEEGVKQYLASSSSV